MNQTYLDSARLLARVAPLVLVDDTFALKGGTAINLFVRDMPRLSVDLDLVFPDACRSRASRPTHRPLQILGRPSCWCGIVASRSRSRSTSSCAAPSIRCAWRR